MSPKQERIIRRLARALLACRDAHISIRGQNADLLAWDDGAWTNVQAGGPGEMVDTVSVRHGGAYVDSGADDVLRGDRIAPKGDTDV